MSRVAIFTDSASDLDPAEAAADGIQIVPLLVNFGVRDLPGRRRPLDRAVLAADDRARRAVSDDRRVVARRLQGRLRSGLRRGRRGDRLGPRGGHAVGDDQERPDRPGHAPGPRDPRHRLARGVDGPGDPARHGRARWRPRAGPAAEIAEVARAAARRTCGCTSRSRRSSTCKQGRPDQRRPGGHRDAALGEADHRGRSTASSNGGAGRGRGRRRANASSS